MKKNTIVAIVLFNFLVAMGPAYFDHARAAEPAIDSSLPKTPNPSAFES